ncbi:Uncharacterized conserved membrane protein [Ceraceosorus bombacis]|uniref:Uncharacterized conserved membrane protein n=1 Tax=Ceraceosorus bombacis TaxID=401625 RepID=A0A0P1BB22_9BASI|nr:Uncharacterized conserved membrane protein [Ceraceosorus bombacis]
MSYGRGSAAFDARDDENERDWVYEAGSADEEEEEEDDSSFEGPRAGSSMSSSALARLAITPTSKSRRRPASLKSPNSRITHHHWYQPAAATPPKTESSSSAWADPAVAKAWGAALANGGVTACGLYVLFHMVSAFASDVRSKAKAHERIHHSEIARCAQQYSLNHCGTPNQAPVLAEQCAAWEACYARDPSTVSSTYKLVAEVFADVVKGFLGPLGYKEMIFVAVMGYLLTTLVVRCTLAFLSQAKLMVQQQASPQAFQPGHSHPRSIAASSFMPPFGVHPSMAQIDHQSARSRPWASQSTAEAQHPRERRVVERSS